MYIYILIYFFIYTYMLFAYVATVFQFISPFTNVFHMLHCTCSTHMCCTEILKNINLQLKPAGAQFFWLQFLLWRKDPSNLPIREVGGKICHNDSFLAVAFTFGGGCGFHDLGRESWVDAWSSSVKHMTVTEGLKKVKLKPIRWNNLQLDSKDYTSFSHHCFPIA